MPGDQGKIDVGKQGRKRTVLPSSVDRTLGFFFHRFSNLAPFLKANAGETGFGVTTPPFTSGLRVSRGRLSDVEFRWNETAKAWEAVDDAGAVIPVGGTPYDDRGLWSGLRASPGRIAFVDDASGVDDPARGMFARPWKTLQYALDNTADGDQICVLPGTYAPPAGYFDESRSWVGVGALGDVVVESGVGNAWQLDGGAWAAPNRFTGISFRSTAGGGNGFVLGNTYRTSHDLRFERCSFEGGAGGRAFETFLGDGGAGGAMEANVMFLGCFFSGDLRIHRNAIVDASVLEFYVVACFPGGPAPASIVVDDQSTHADGVVVLAQGTTLDSADVTSANTATCLNLGAGSGFDVRVQSIALGTDPMAIGFGTILAIENTSGVPITLAAPNFPTPVFPGQRLTVFCSGEWSAVADERVVIPPGIGVYLKDDVPMNLCVRRSPGVPDAWASIDLIASAVGASWVEVRREEARIPAFNGGIVPGGMAPPTPVYFDRSPSCAFTMDGDCTFLLNNMRPGETCRLILTENGFGGHAVAFATPILWEGGVPPVHTMAAGSVDIYVFWFDGTVVYGGALLDMK